MWILTLSGTNAPEPTIRDELNRKTLDTLEHLTFRYVSGTLDLERYAIAVESIFGCVAGLVGPEFIEMIGYADQMIKEARIKNAGQ